MTSSRRDIPALLERFVGTFDYDPVCFDISSRKKNGECRVVKIDHEQILCNYRVKVVAELAPTFEQLVLETIRRADQAKIVQRLNCLGNGDPNF